MKIKDALPDRKVKIEIHFVDAYGKAIREPAFVPEDQGHNKSIIATVTNVDKIRTFVHQPGKRVNKMIRDLSQKEYLAVIPQQTKYVFYVREVHNG